MNRVRARTSSTNPALRLLYVGIAFLLLNVWVHFALVFAKERRPRRDAAATGRSTSDS